MSQQMLEPLIDGLGDVIGWVIIAPIAALGEGVRRAWSRLQTLDDRVDDLEDNHEDIRRHLELEGEGQPRLAQHDDRMRAIERMQARQERYFLGDEDDPTDKGLLKEVDEIHETVRQEHEER